MVQKVEPIKSKVIISEIKKSLSDHPRNFALFVCGINFGFRGGDLLNIKVEQVKDLKVGDDFEVKEQKTKKFRRITLNQNCFDAIQNLLNHTNFDDGSYLFQSQRAEKLTVNSLCRLVKMWTGKYKSLKGNYGSHTLRKTFGYHKRLQGTDIPTLMIMFNHSTQKQTLIYLCIQDDEIKNVYMDNI